jgi:hypothetical protein
MALSLAAISSLRIVATFSRRSVSFPVTLRTLTVALSLACTNTGITQGSNAAAKSIEVAGREIIFISDKSFGWRDLIGNTPLAVKKMNLFVQA